MKSTLPKLTVPARPVPAATVVPVKMIIGGKEVDVYKAQRVMPSTYSGWIDLKVSQHEAMNPTLPAPLSPMPTSPQEAAAMALAMEAAQQAALQGIPSNSDELSSCAPSSS